MLKNRIIPCLDVKNGRVVKGINFVDLKDAGDPVEQAKILNNNIEGIIVGKAIYDGDIKLEELAREIDA